MLVIESDRSEEAGYIDTEPPISNWKSVSNSFWILSVESSPVPVISRVIVFEGSVTLVS